MEYLCIDSYKNTKEEMEGYFENCPKCSLKPKLWVYDNGSSTACGCGENIYNHFSIHAESIMSVVKRSNGSCIDYNRDDIRKNWNHWVKTGEIIFEHAGKRNDNRW